MTHHVTEPNEFDEFRQRQERRRRLAIRIRIIDVLTALVLAAIAALVLKMIIYES
jgi:type IV secretory pathway component VirB8